MADHTKRMGRTMPYTSQDGVSHPESFWCLNFLATDIGGRNGRIEFVGYHSAAAYDADSQPVAGATRSYQFAADAFDAAVYEPTKLPTGSPLAGEIISAAWGIALAAKEIGEPPADGEPDARTSFFAASTPA